MCGILGLVTTKKGLIDTQSKKLVKNILKLSESRGKESAGMAVLSEEKIEVSKLPKPAHILIKSKGFKKIFSENILATIGHTRLVTNGILENNYNNQPVIKDRIVGIHNGIVTNVEDIWKKHQDIKRHFQIDTEVILSLVRKYYRNSSNLAESIRLSFREIEGSASIALLFEDLDVLALATNTGSLYIAADQKSVVFASEANFLKRALRKSKLMSKSAITQILPSTGLIIDLKNLKKFRFSLNKKNLKVIFRKTNRKIYDISNYPKFLDPKFEIKVSNKIKADFKSFNKKIRALKRCTRCILPETFPFIEFDQGGGCNYCRHYEIVKPKGKKSLDELVAPFRAKGKYDCLVTFSGGRDSSYGLHYVKKVLKMHPIAYSYDWGMITDLGRRNQARLTGKLGIEQILISADIAKKRKNIRKNVLAWLKNPDLGVIPLFMAGDKQYFYFANKLRKELGIKLIILCINPYEKTDFKFGFCGVKPDAQTFYRLNLHNRMKMAMHYTKAYISNLSYINSSLWDTLSAFGSYYFIKHNYLSFYEYINWDEKTIEKTLINNYNWETAPDTKTTWRIGDGTASFYNYIYYLMAGFTENDTFRSNQIRQGILSRREALEKSEFENMPRWESIQWYCDTIGIDAQKTLEIINAAPKRYKL